VSGDAVLVVELRLGDRVIDVDGGNSSVPAASSRTAGGPGGGLLGHALDRIRTSIQRPSLGEGLADELRKTRHSASPRPAARHLAGLLASALVHEHGGVATVVEDHVGQLVVGQLRIWSYTTSTPPASRPSRRRPVRPWDRPACRPGPTTTRPRHGPEWRRCCSSPTAPRRQGHQGLDQHRRLHRHVQRAGDPGPASGLDSPVLRCAWPSARHLVLGRLISLRPNRRGSGRQRENP
jgi:hypothetical protein